MKTKGLFGKSLAVGNDILAERESVILPFFVVRGCFWTYLYLKELMASLCIIGHI
jgi:hypothetical protein